MPLHQTVEQHHRLMYSNAVQMVAQQSRSHLAGTVTEIAGSGEAINVSDLFGTVEYAYGEERTRTNYENPVAGTRRWAVRPPEIKSGQYIDEEDKLDSATDPTSNFVRAHTMAVTRGWDDRILGIRKAGASFTVTDGGILGIAREGKTPGAGTALPSGQFIPHGSTGMTVDKMRDAVLALRKAEFGMEDSEQLYCLVSPTQVDDLLAIAQASATALNAFAIQQLQAGKPTPLMGLTWLMTNRLPVDAGGRRLCPVYSKRNIVNAAWTPIQGDMWNDTHADNKPYVRVRARLDVVRLEDKGVVVIECAE